MPFGGGGGDRSRPSALPKSTSITRQGGELERRKRARDRSGTLLSRGLLTESPAILYPELKTTLG